MSPTASSPHDPISPVTEVLTKKTLREFGVPFSNAQLLRLERRGEFPRRFHLTSKCPAWRLAEIREWVDARQRATEPNVITEQATAANRRRRSNSEQA